MAKVNFFCTECSGEIFDTSLIPNGVDSFMGTICQNCGHIVTETDDAQVDDESIGEITDFSLRDKAKQR